MSKPKAIINQEQALKNLIRKYEGQPRAIHGCVYKLSYAGKYVIVKGKTLIGSLALFQTGYSWFREEALKKNTYYLYEHFYRHIKANTGRFRIKILSRSTKPYFLLKREQIEIDKARYDPNFLLNATEAYIPIFREKTDSFGWIPKTDVGRFKRYLTSQQRQRVLDEYSMKRQLRLAKHP